jgi:hypothetical protein
MGMSTHVIGFKPPDAAYTAKLEAYNACKKASITPPEELQRFFNWTEPDPQGITVRVPTREWNNDHASGYEVDISGLDPSVKVIRFYNSW